MAINLSNLDTRQIQNALQRGAKDVLVASGIQPSTRRGNKELDLAVQRLAQQPYSTLEEATQTGKALGQKIVELSQAKGKTVLDGGIVRQMMLTGEIPTVVKVTAKPAKTTPVVVNAKAHEPVELEAVGRETAAETPSGATADLKTEELDVEIVTDETDLVTDEAGLVADEVDLVADEAGLVTDEAEVVTDEADLVTDETEVVTDEAGLVADEADLVADEVEVVTEEADLAAEEADLAAEESGLLTDEAEVVAEEADLLADEAEVVADDIIAAETGEALDPEVADAPDLEAIETLEPEAIAAPEPEPAVAADAKSAERVDAIDSSNLAKADEDLPSSAKAEMLAAPDDADDVVEPKAIGAGK